MVMKKQFSEKELFETVPVSRAVATLAIPTIISQVVTMIYNLADTFFVGQIGNPYMVAAVSLASPWFNLLTALGNLFGLGGGNVTIFLPYLCVSPAAPFFSRRQSGYIRLC